MRLLALDPATTTGFSHGEVGKRPISGIVRLPSQLDGRRFNALEGRVRQLVSANQIDRVIIERSFVSTTHFSQDQAGLAYGYRAAIMMAMDKEGMAEHVIEVSSASWRSNLNIRTQAPKHVDAKDRRKWLKDDCLRACRELGFQPATNDEADALGVWLYGETLFSQGDANERMPLFNTVKV